MENYIETKKPLSVTERLYAVRTGFFSVHTNGGNYPQIRIQNGYITISLLLF